MPKAKSALAPLAKSKVKARSAVKGLSVAELEKLVANLSAILKSEKQKASQRATAAKKAKIAKIRAMMAESGLKPSDLSGAGRAKTRKSKARRSGAKVAPKYRLVIKGEEHLWSGRGRPPRVFKEYFDSGKSRESCAI